MKLIIDIPEEFTEHFAQDKFVDSLGRLGADAHLLAGNFERELALMLIKAFKNGTPYEERPTGKWIVTAEDNEGVHRIQCPFCGYEKGSDFADYITVTFERMPPFCENCGARLEAENEDT